MVSILFTNILNSNIINYQSELDWPCDILSQASRDRCMDILIVTMGGQHLSQWLIGGGSRRRQSINGFEDLQAKVPIFCMFLHAILISDVVGKHWREFVMYSY